MIPFLDGIWSTRDFFFFFLFSHLLCVVTNSFNHLINPTLYLEHRLTLFLFFIFFSFLPFCSCFLASSWSKRQKEEELIIRSNSLIKFLEGWLKKVG